MHPRYAYPLPPPRGGEIALSEISLSVVLHMASLLM